MPRVIYCIHALSTHLFKLGKAPQIQDLYGKVNFTGTYLITYFVEKANIKTSQMLQHFIFFRGRN